MGEELEVVIENDENIDLRGRIEKLAWTRYDDQLDHIPKPCKKYGSYGCIGAMSIGVLVFLLVQFGVIPT